MFLTNPVTGKPSIPFTLFAMECEGEFNNVSEEEDSVDDDEDETENLD